jgi:ribokinase
VYQALDVLCINEGECEFLSGISCLNDDSREKALRFFERRGVGHTVITLGRRGSVTLVDGKIGQGAVLLCRDRGHHGRG